MARALAETASFKIAKASLFLFVLEANTNRFVESSRACEPLGHKWIAPSACALSITSRAALG